MPLGLLLVKRATVKSKTEPQGWFVLHDDDSPTVWAEFVVPMNGRLDGFTCHVRFERVDGRIFVGDILYHPSSLMPLDAATVTSLRDLRLGDMPNEAEACLRIIANLGHGMDWLEAFEATRRRAGRAGRAPQFAARVALQRMEAERQSPGNAIRYMLDTWPGEFVSESAAHSKINKAITKGMLERVDGALHLTETAKRLLEGKE